MSLELRRELDQLWLCEWRRVRLCDKAVDHREAADNSRCRRAQAAGVWNLVTAEDLKPGRGGTCRLEPMFDRPHHQVRRIQRNLAGAFALDFDGEAGFGCFDDDFV